MAPTVPRPHIHGGTSVQKSPERRRFSSSTTATTRRHLLSTIVIVVVAVPIIIVVAVVVLVIVVVTVVAVVFKDESRHRLRDARQVLLQTDRRIHVAGFLHPSGGVARPSQIPMARFLRSAPQCRRMTCATLPTQCRPMQLEQDLEIH